MAFRKKCRECMSCMSPVWKGVDRYMYCGFCKQYYAGHIDNLIAVESPFQPAVSLNTVEDPIEDVTDTYSSMDN